MSETTSFVKRRLCCVCQDEVFSLAHRCGRCLFDARIVAAAPVVTTQVDELVRSAIAARDVEERGA